MPQSGIEQALFGYDDGHRMLVSSTSLPGSVASDFTILSDLAPGVQFENSEGYWTGVPVPQIRRYALMRTWPAPEMPRPGCVWSHVLFLPTELLEYVEDLYALTDLAVRPGKDHNRAEYSRPLHPRQMITPPAEPASLSRAEEMLDALYSPTRARALSAAPGELDRLIFEVWSQQWPKLRRNFRFQTAVADASTTFGDRKFDLRLSRESGRFVEIEPVPMAYQSNQWLETATADLQGLGRGSLRPFLREFGADVKRPRYSFPQLVRVYEAAISERLEGQGAYDILELVGEAFEEPGDALALKHALTSSDTNSLTTDLISRLKFLLMSRHGDSYPPVSASVISDLGDLWPERADALLDLADLALNSHRPVAESVVQAVLGAIPDVEFWRATSALPKLQSIGLGKRLDLLALANPSDLSDASLMALLDGLKPGPWLKPLLPKLLERDDPRIAQWARSADGPAIQALLLDRLGDGQALPRAWIDLLTTWPDQIFLPDRLQRVQSWSGLYRLAEAFGFASGVVLASEPLAWVGAIKRAKNDATPDNRLHLSATLFWLAVISPAPKGRIDLLAEVFDAVFQVADRSYLPFRTREYLDQVLPKMRYNNYDIASRMLMSLAIAFVYKSLPASGINKVTQNKSTMKALKKLLDSFPDGRKFLKGLK